MTNLETKFIDWSTMASPDSENFHLTFFTTKKCRVITLDLSIMDTLVYVIYLNDWRLELSSIREVTVVRIRVPYCLIFKFTQWHKHHRCHSFRSENSFTGNLPCELKIWFRVRKTQGTGTRYHSNNLRVLEDVLVRYSDFQFKSYNFLRGSCLYEVIYMSIQYNIG